MKIIKNEYFTSETSSDFGIKICKLLGILFLFFNNVFGNHWPPNVANQLTDGDIFDFIVVGSGSGGSPVAARLAQRGQNVLLLEAGGEPPLTTRVPGLAVINLLSDVDWKFTSEHEDCACQSLLNQSCHKPRGKVLGGSSAINYMIYSRGNKIDYDDWNIPSWTYEKMLPYFRRLESLTDYDDLSPELKPYHNNNGPVKASLINATFIPWRDRLLNAYQEIGFERNWDINGPSQIGVTVTHTTIYNGERQSTAEAYLVPNANNSNLNVAYNSYVTRIIIDENNIAKGVRVSVDGKKEITIRAKKEIILSSGTINTPQLLMLSGIGPESELKRHGIQIYFDNPHVGQRLQDHPSTPIVFTANTGTVTPVSGDVKKDLLTQWLKDRSGPLATIFAVDISVFVDTTYGSSVPDVQFMHTYIDRNNTVSLFNVLTKAFTFNDETLKDIQELNKESEILIIMPTLLRPASRGSIHLASKNSYKHPIINANTLIESEDYDTYLRAVRLLENILTTETFQRHGVKLARINSLKECNDHEFQSDDYWICYRNNLGDTIFHPVGTAAIDYIVDERLRVYGVKRLRVADASVMPLVSRGNTNVPTIAIGERAADFISEDHDIYIEEFE